MDVSALCTERRSVAEKRFSSWSKARKIAFVSYRSCFISRFSDMLTLTVTLTSDLFDLCEYNTVQLDAW